MSEIVTFEYRESGLNDMMHLEHPLPVGKKEFYVVKASFYVGYIIFINDCWRFKQADSVLDEDRLYPIADKLKELNSQ